MSVSQAVERCAVAAMMICLALDDSAAVSNPQHLTTTKNWQHCQKLMQKPGKYFINTLRRFPYAVDSGRIGDDDMAECQHYVDSGMQPEPNSAHEGAIALSQWCQAAMHYWRLRKKTPSYQREQAILAKKKKPNAAGSNKDGDKDGGSNNQSRGYVTTSALFNDSQSRDGTKQSAKHHEADRVSQTLLKSEAGGELGREYWYYIFSDWAYPLLTFSRKTAFCVPNGVRFWGCFFGTQICPQQHNCHYPRVPDSK